MIITTKPEPKVSHVVPSTIVYHRYKRNNHPAAQTGLGRRCPKGTAFRVCPGFHKNTLKKAIPVGTAQAAFLQPPNARVFPPQDPLRFTGSQFLYVRHDVDLFDDPYDIIMVGVALALKGHHKAGEFITG